MSELAFKEKITKSVFESKLIKDFGHRDLSARPYVEDGQKLMLYYVKLKGVEIPLHIGTYSKGQGWIFKHAYNKE